MNDVRFGLVGYGLWGAHHGRAIQSTDGAVLKAVAARTEASRTAAANAHPGVEAHADYRELIAREDIDLVDVVVPNHLHYEVARAALAAGKHVLLEKPMALTLRHCAELVRLAGEQGCLLALNHELRLSTLWGRIRQLVDEGRIGSPQHLLIELSRFPYRTGSDGWRYDLERVGNWILEEPIHFFDLARWYLASNGQPQTVYARANSRRADHPELNDNFSAMIDFAGGAYAVVSQTLSAFGHHVSAKLVGTEGAAWAWWSAPDARSDKPLFGLRYGAGDQVTEETFDNVPGELAELHDQIAHVVRSVRERKAPSTTAADGHWAVAMCLAAIRSVASGKIEPISLEDGGTAEFCGAEHQFTPPTPPPAQLE